MARASDPTPWPVARPVMAGISTLLVLLTVTGFWSVSVTIRGAVIASGQVETTQSRHVIQHPEGGSVVDVAVGEGDAVRAGQLLLRLDGGDIDTALALARSQLIETRASRERLEGERDLRDELRFSAALRAEAAGEDAHAAMLAVQANLFAARRDTLQVITRQVRQRIAQIGNQIAGLQARRQALERQLSLVAASRADQQTLLDRGLSQAGQLALLRRQEAEIEGNIGAIAAAIAEARGRITELEMSLTHRRAEYHERALAQLRETRLREDEIAAELAVLERRRADLEIRAQFDGVVFDLRVETPGVVLAAAEPALFVIPQGRDLRIEVRVPSTDIDQVTPGQTTRMRFPGLDRATPSNFHGTVLRISADTYLDEVSGQRFFKVIVSLPRAEVERLPRAALLPGVPVEVFFETTARTPLVYLTAPLMRYFDRTFTEG